jgi:mRNA interferase RelE/StbE
MQFQTNKSFERDLKKSPVSVLSDVLLVYNQVAEASAIKGIPNLKKLSGYKNAYRIRIGEYRIGLYLEGDVFVFARILPRKEIYRFFP